MTRTKRPTVDADEVLGTVAALLGAMEYAEGVRTRICQYGPATAALIMDAGADVARAELALVDLLGGQDYDPRALVREVLHTARSEARARAEAAVAELRTEAGR